MKCSEDKGFWVARDKSGTLCLYLGEPFLNGHSDGEYLSSEGYLILDESMFQEVIWDDPIRVDLLRPSELESIIIERLRNEMFRR